jgi:hypothetical protein
MDKSKSSVGKSFGRILILTNIFCICFGLYLGAYFGKKQYQLEAISVGAGVIVPDDYGKLKFEWISHVPAEKPFE